jgi:hypothetical protein
MFIKHCPTMVVLVCKAALLVVSIGSALFCAVPTTGT